MPDILTFYKTEEEKGHATISAALGVSGKNFRKLMRSIGMALAESLTGQEQDDGIFVKCESPVDVLKKYVTEVDTKEKFGVDPDTLNGCFILGFAFFEALHGIGEATEAMAFSKFRKMAGTSGIKDDLKKLLDEL